MRRGILVPWRDRACTSSADTNIKTIVATRPIPEVDGNRIRVTAVAQQGGRDHLVWHRYVVIAGKGAKEKRLWIDASLLVPDVAPTAQALAIDINREAIV
jgi:hypothetical protein